MTSTVSADNPALTKQRVVYLLGAGATHGGIKFYGGSSDILMPHLSQELFDDMRDLLQEQFSAHLNLETLVNSVVNSETDFEQLITFLEESVSATHRAFAGGLKYIFAHVLRSRLKMARQELGDRHCLLYATLIDLYNVIGFDESLNGFLTLNYDDFLERAILDHMNSDINYGVAIDTSDPSESAIRVLKLHGSFSWSEHWPIESSEEGESLWIPPGIRKRKTEYPFNAIWGLARELLDCDILRIIGCNLGANDWDLVSLLFTTKHLNARSTPYQVEMITDFSTATRVKTQFPYLDVRHFVEVEDIGPQIVSELLSGEPRSFDQLSFLEAKTLEERFQSNVPNPFAYWLKMKGESVRLDLPTVATELNLLEMLLDSYT